jgi:carbamoyl-phosphate synthase small subunit
MGNYGINPEDMESRGIQVEGFIVKEYHPYPSNWRSRGNLADYLKAEGKLGVEGFDTRAVTKRLREAGAMRGIISTEDLNPDSLVRRARDLPSMEGLDLVPLVTCSHPHWWDESAPSTPFTEFVGAPRAVPDAAPPPSAVSCDLEALWNQRSGTKVALYDYGVKFNIIRSLKARGLEVLVVPATTPAADILRLKPAGIVLSNGPGDPAAVTYAIDNVRQCLGHSPMFGICLGHQLMGLGLGGRTFKLKFGHRGANQPVKNLVSGRVEITSQNHGFAVDIESIPDPEVELTHFNLNDGTLEGLRHPKLRAFSVQYHPEASPGPHDADYLFEEFIKLIER